MAPTAPAAALTSQLTKLGFTTGLVVQEIGYDDDVDQSLREAIQAATGAELEDEDYQDVCDAVLLWHREEDDDLTDAVVDALTELDDEGFVLLLTPKTGREGHVAPSEIAEAATTAGLHTAGMLNACADWVGTRLAAPKGQRR